MFLDPAETPSPQSSQRRNRCVRCRAGPLIPFWDAANLAEAAWIIGANLAYALIGVAVFQSELVGVWAGWAALGVGIVIPAVVLLTRFGFPQLAVIVPFILGVA